MKITICGIFYKRENGEISEEFDKDMDLAVALVLKSRRSHKNLIYVPSDKSVYANKLSYVEGIAIPLPLPLDSAKSNIGKKLYYDPETVDLIDKAFGLAMSGEKKIIEESHKLISNLC